MNTAHLHLILNHLPVLGTFFGVALLGFALVRKNAELTKAGLATLVFSALAAIPAFATGEGAEHAVEHLPGVSEKLIERHEDAAGIALAALEVTGALALGAWILGRLGRAPRALAPATLAAALAAAGLMSWTALLGGQIRHTEIASSGASASTSTSAPESRSSQHARHDDDD